MPEHFGILEDMRDRRDPALRGRHGGIGITGTGRALNRTGTGRGTIIPAASDEEKLEFLGTRLDQPMPMAYGRHLVAGAPIFQHLLSTGTTILLIALGDGEWDAAEVVWVNGKSIDLADTNLVHFHPGLDGSTGIETVPATRNQQICSFFPAGFTGLTFSRAAYIALKLPPDPTAPGPEFDIRGIYKTRRVRTFDSAGTQLTYAFSSNPAWCLLDAYITLVLRPHALINEALVQADKDKIDFSAFSTAASDCDVDIGAGKKRFESHVAFLEQTSLGEIFETFLALSRGYLLEQDGKLGLYMDKARSSVFTFTTDKIVEASFEIPGKDPRALTNRIVIKARDIESGAGTASKDFAPWTKTLDDETHQDFIGRIIKHEFDLGANTRERSERLGRYWMKRSLLREQARLVATLDAGKLLPGDIVTAPKDHTFVGTREWEVLEITDGGLSPGAPGAQGDRELFCQEYDPAIFSDTAETQQAVEAPNVIIDKLPAGAPFNVKYFGAKGDGNVVFDGAITSGSAVLTSASGKFKASHVGLAIRVFAAGAAGADLNTTISSFQSATQVTLAAAAGTTVAGTEAMWGGTDDTTAIQKAIDAVSDIHPGLLFPGGGYVYSAAFTYNKFLREVFGEGKRSSIIFAASQSIATRLLDFIDAQHLKIARMGFIGPGMSAVSGGKLDFRRTNNSNINDLKIQDIEVFGCADTGIAVSVPILSSFRNVRVKRCAVNGFHIYGGGTSTKFRECYAVTLTQTGFLIDGCVYVGLDTCAAEVAGIGYEILNSFNVGALNCGAESQVNRSPSYPGHAWKINGGEAIHLDHCYSRDIPLTTDRHVLVTGLAKRVLIDGFRRLNGAVTPAFSVQIDTGAEDVIIKNPNFPKTELSNSGTRSGYLRGFGGGDPDFSDLDLDNIPDRVSGVYGRARQTALTAGEVDMAKAGVINRVAANIAETADLKWRRAAHSSYRPTTNPLTATDAGTTATINIAAFTMRVPGLDILIDLGSITGLLFDTVYFLHYSDANFVGGAVTFFAETVKELTINALARFFVGSIRTPKDGEVDTVGNNDGGSGAQYGSLDFKPPTIDAAVLGGGATDPLNAYDFDQSTFASVNDNDVQNNHEQHDFKGFETPDRRSAQTAVQLKILSEALKSGAGTVTNRIAYSTDGGASFTNVFSVNAARAKQLDTISLGATTNLSRVVVRIACDWVGGASTTGEVRLYETWIEVTR